MPPVTMMAFITHCWKSAPLERPGPRARWVACTRALWGLLLAHFAIRQLMAQAAWQHLLDPDRLSFVHAVRVIKRKMPQAAAIPP